MIKLVYFLLGSFFGYFMGIIIMSLFFISKQNDEIKNDSEKLTLK